MKKNKLLISTAILALVGMSTGSMLSYAAGTGTTDDPAQGEATIVFEENNNPTEPKDPTDPTKPNPGPFPDGNNDDTEAVGPLSLDVYPSSFDFGTQKIDMNGGTYTSTKTGLHVLQVTDQRDDLGGWSVSMVRTEFTDGASKQLTGSALYIPTGVARNGLTDDPTGADPNIKIATASGTGDFSGMHEIGTVETTIIGAEDDLANLAGKGTTAYSWDAGGEKLVVPSGAAKAGTFTSKINWVLNATPMS